MAARGRDERCVKDEGGQKIETSSYKVRDLIIGMW